MRFSETLPFGDYRVTLSTSVTDLAGNGLAEPFVSQFLLDELPVVAARGTPGDPFVASANVGQEMLINAEGLDENSEVVFPMRGSFGVAYQLAVAVELLSLDGTLGRVFVPSDADTGPVELPDGTTLDLQIVPVVSGINGGRGRLTTLSGTGFIEGVTTIRFGGVEVVDGGPSFDDGIDTFSANTRMSVVVPDNGTLPYEVVTEGGSSGQPADVVDIVAATTIGMPANLVDASTNVDQQVTLLGSGFVEGVTLVAVEAMNSFGVPYIANVTPSSIAVDGLSLIFTVPSEANTGFMSLLSGGAGQQLLIVPTLSSVNTAMPGNLATLAGTGFIEGLTTATFGAVSVVDGGPSFNDGIDVFSANTRANVTVPASGAAPVTVTTAGGTSYSASP